MSNKKKTTNLKPSKRDEESYENTFLGGDEPLPEGEELMTTHKLGEDAWNRIYDNFGESKKRK